MPSVFSGPGHGQSEGVHIHEEDLYLTIRCLEKYGDISLIYAFDKTITSGISSCLSVYINGSPFVVQSVIKALHPDIRYSNLWNGLPSRVSLLFISSTTYCGNEITQQSPPRL
jgi:hypothetical protein